MGGLELSPTMELEFRPPSCSLRWCLMIGSTSPMKLRWQSIIAKDDAHPAHHKPPVHSVPLRSWAWPPAPTPPPRILRLPSN